MDKRSEKKPEDKKRSEEKMQKERPVEEKGAREEEEKEPKEKWKRDKEAVKKRKVAEQAPPSYWDWLPPELQEDVEKKALYALIQERLDKGFRAIDGEMAELPRCRLHGTVS